MDQQEKDILEKDLPQIKRIKLDPSLEENQVTQDNNALKACEGVYQSQKEHDIIQSQVTQKDHDLEQKIQQDFQKRVLEDDQNMLEDIKQEKEIGLDNDRIFCSEISDNQLNSFKENINNKQKIQDVLQNLDLNFALDQIGQQQGYFSLNFKQQMYNRITQKLNNQQNNTYKYFIIQEAINNTQLEQQKEGGNLSQDEKYQYILQNITNKVTVRDINQAIQKYNQSLTQNEAQKEQEQNQITLINHKINEKQEDLSNDKQEQDTQQSQQQQQQQQINQNEQQPTSIRAMFSNNSNNTKSKSWSPFGTLLPLEDTKPHLVDLGDFNSRQTFNFKSNQQQAQYSKLNQSPKNMPFFGPQTRFQIPAKQRAQEAKDSVPDPPPNTKKKIKLKKVEFAEEENLIDVRYFNKDDPIQVTYTHQQMHEEWVREQEMQQNQTYYLPGIDQYGLPLRNGVNPRPGFIFSSAPQAYNKHKRIIQNKLSNMREQAPFYIPATVKIDPEWNYNEHQLETEEVNTFNFYMQQIKNGSKSKISYSDLNQQQNGSYINNLNNIPVQIPYEQYRPQRKQEQNKNYGQSLDLQLNDQSMEDIDFQPSPQHQSTPYQQQQQQQQPGICNQQSGLGDIHETQANNDNTSQAIGIDQFEQQQDGWQQNQSNLYGQQQQQSYQLQNVPQQQQSIYQQNSQAPYNQNTIVAGDTGQQFNLQLSQQGQATQNMIQGQDNTQWNTNRLLLLYEKDQYHAITQNLQEKLPNIQVYDPNTETVHVLGSNNVLVLPILPPGVKSIDVEQNRVQNLEQLIQYVQTSLTKQPNLSQNSIQMQQPLPTSQVQQQQYQPQVIHYNGPSSNQNIQMTPQFSQSPPMIPVNQQNIAVQKAEQAQQVIQIQQPQQQQQLLNQQYLQQRQQNSQQPPQTQPRTNISLQLNTNSHNSIQAPQSNLAHNNQEYSIPVGQHSKQRPTYYNDRDNYEVGIDMGQGQDLGYGNHQREGSYGKKGGKYGSGPDTYQNARRKHYRESDENERHTGAPYRGSKDSYGSLPDKGHGRGAKHQTYCVFFNSQSGCKKGDNCPFNHEYQGRQQHRDRFSNRKYDKSNIDIKYKNDKS